MTPLSSIAGTVGGTDTRPEKVVGEMEALLFREVLKSMRRTIPENENRQEIYDAWFDGAIADVMGQSGLLDFEELLGNDGPDVSLRSEALIFPIDGARRNPQAAQAFGASRPKAGGGHRRHEGLDIPAPKGSKILAAHGGKVVSIQRENVGLGGRSVVLQRGGLQTRYFHLDHVREDLRVGDMIAQTNTLGTVGSSGQSSTGNHLHFEIRVKTDTNGWQNVDPGRVYYESQE